MMVAQLLTSFISTTAFGIIFNAPKKSLIHCGFVGMIGWIIYVCLVNNKIGPVPATLVSAFFIAIISLLFARIYKMPIIIFSVAGMIPLVPGGMAYSALRHFVENDYNTAIQLAAKSFMLSGAIAMGMVLSEVLNQMIKKVNH